MKLRLAISTTNGEKVVDVEIVQGVFAVHQTQLDDDTISAEWWTLTHAPSGRAAHAKLCCDASAKALAVELSGLNWDFTVSREVQPRAFPEPVKSEMQKARKICQEWAVPCAACRVERAQ